MKRRMAVVFLLLALPAVANGSDFPTNWDANPIYGNAFRVCILQIREAIYHNNNPTASFLRQQYESGGLKNRYRKPSAIRIRKSKNGIGMVLLWRTSTGYDCSQFACGTDFTGDFPSIIGQPAIAINESRLFGCDSPSLAKELESRFSANRSSIGAIAAKGGFDASLSGRSIVLTRKYFRQGMNDEEFKKALHSTMDEGLKGADVETMASTAVVNYLRAVTALRNELGLLPYFTTKRACDYREFSMEIQREILNIVELQRVASEWQFLQFVANQ
jgi:hypothetical protein